ncbi:MAG TPA: M20/M25/M40 family metallo-hydrolase [Thermotogota bacterium]|nr:M20/M25/M40 family metallo-hydrolase [Thermotogota bacterium]HRW91845.1 M20/M25/M40 family metallo-hydrolase [Thermotogota bacterium]
MDLQALCEINGASGNEEKVREWIQNRVQGMADHLTQDPVGNLVATKRGKNPAGKSLLVMAHMDEVGLMVTGYEEDGRLSVMPVGGVDPRVLPGKKVVVGKDALPGVIGYKAIHLQREDFSTPPKWENIRVEMGFGKKEDCKKKVKIGDYVHFYSPFEELPRRFLGKAFDDRGGCALLIHALEKMSPVDYDVHFAFVVQEEIGLRGSGAVLKQFRPTCALIVEGTTAGDNPELEKARWSTILDQGPAISYLQGGYALDTRLLDVILGTAREHAIPFQMKGRTVGGTDASRLARTYSGIPGGGINIPSRYIHSPASVISKKDYENTGKLLLALVQNKKYLDVMEG